MSGKRLVSAAWYLCFCASLFAASETTGKRLFHLSLRLPPEQQELLNENDLSVQVNGEDAAVLSMKTPRDPQMILVVLDLAEDVTDAQAARNALIETVKSLPASTLVAVIRAQDGPIVLVGPTTDRNAVTQAILGSSVTGKAGLLDSLASVETLAAGISQVSGVRLALLYVTDSSVRNYREDFANPVINSSDSHDLSRRFPEALIQDKMNKMEMGLAIRETPLFIVHLRYSTATLNAAYQSGLKRLADDTGGWSVFCASTAEIREAIGNAFSTIASEYLLTVGLPQSVQSTLHIHVGMRSQDKPPDEIIYRSRLAMKPDSQ